MPRWSGVPPLILCSARAGEDAECSSATGACQRGDNGGWSTEADPFLSSSRCNIRKIYMRWQDGGISAENFRKYLPHTPPTHPSRESPRCGRARESAPTTARCCGDLQRAWKCRYFADEPVIVVGAKDNSKCREVTRVFLHIFTHVRACAHVPTSMWATRSLLLLLLLLWV